MIPPSRYEHIATMLAQAEATGAPCCFAWVECVVEDGDEYTRVETSSATNTPFEAEGILRESLRNITRREIISGGYEEEDNDE